MDPITNQILQGIAPLAGAGSTLERNALIGVIRNLISEDKYTVDYILDYAESVGYSRQMAEDVFKELTGLSPKLIVNNNEYYNMPVYVPNMCIAWGISKSNKEKAFYIVPFEYGYSVMEKDEVNAPVSTVICATIPEAFEELKKVAKNIQTLDKIITKKLLEAENVPTTADNPHQVNLPYSASPLQILKKNFKDKVLSVSEFERQASKLLEADEITVDEAEDLMAWKQDLIDEDETYGNDVLELNEQWNEVQATLNFRDVYNEMLEMAAEDKDSLGTENTAETVYNLHANLFKNVDLIEAATRLYQLLLGLTEDEILGYSKFEKKKSSSKKVKSKQLIVDVFDIDWDIDEDSTGEYAPDELPDYWRSLKINVEDENDDEIEDEISNFLSNKFGFAVDGFHFTKQASKKVKSEKIMPSEIYDIAISKLPSEDIDHHNSDLYIKVTPESKKLVETLEYKDSGMLTTFKDDKGTTWYELPFCYPMGKQSSKKVTAENLVDNKFYLEMNNLDEEQDSELLNALQKFYDIAGFVPPLFDKDIDWYLLSHNLQIAYEKNGGRINNFKGYTSADNKLLTKELLQSLYPNNSSELINLLSDIEDITPSGKVLRKYDDLDSIRFKSKASKKVTAENMTLEDIEAEDNKDEIQEEIEKIEDTPVEEIFEEETPEQYFDKALQEDKVDTINDVVSKCVDKFSEKFKDFDKYTIKILSYNTKVLGEYTPVKEEMVKDDEINANAILQIILSIANNADETNIKKALVVFSITNGKLHWTGTVRGENDQVVAFTEEGLDALFEVEEPSEEELEDIV